MLILLGVLLTPMSAFCNYEKSLLWAYLDALSKGSTKEIGALLSPNFEYHFYKDNKLYVINRKEELESLSRLFEDSVDGFNLPDLFSSNIKDWDNLPLDKWNKFRVQFTIFFNDSPKVYTGSFFRGALLDIDETLLVTVDDDHKILKIIEQKDLKRKTKLSFGYLKAIHLRKLETKSYDKNGPVVDGGVVNGDLKNELFDKNSHQLLLTSIQRDIHGGIEESYYWPNKRHIYNLHP